MPPDMKYPPPKLGGPQRTFADQMELDQLDSHTFYSRAGASGGYVVKFRGRMRERTYGGHVYAQAAWAAAHTVPKGFTLHTMSGFFVSAGWADVPFIYRVKVARDGQSYCIRNVEVSQMDTDSLCFTCTCSFKTAERPVVEGDESTALGVEVQEPEPPEVRFKEFLKGRRPQDCGELDFEEGDAKGFDLNTTRGVTTAWTSTKIGLLPMKEFNDPRHPLDRVTLHYYSVAGPIPNVEEAPNLHVSNHLYLADRMAVHLIAEHNGVLPHLKSYASLSSTVIFHGGPEALSMYDKDGNERWFCQEVRSDRLADGRGTNHSRIWDDQGRHVATTIQDGQVRLKFKDKDQMEKFQKDTNAKPKI